jgi:hypothetical protein
MKLCVIVSDPLDKGLIPFPKLRKLGRGILRSRLLILLYSVYVLLLCGQNVGPVLCGSILDWVLC